MNFQELDSFNLADAVKFHDRLNPRLWDRKEHLRPEVHAKLLEIARDFQEFLGVPDLDVKDITVSGSNAAYNYTPTSDIDLHLVVDLPEADNSEVYRELFDAKKYQYNAQHNIKIGGFDVELYVQNPHQEHHSQGIYSLLKNAWVSVPRRRKAEIDDISTKSKYEDLAARINDTVSSGDKDSMALLMKKIKAMRQAGLEQQGEFSADNLTFKLLRNNGYIKRLIDARNAARDAELSLAEKAKPRQRVTYGYVSESPDGVNPSTKMFLEEPGSNDEATVHDFIDFVAQKLGITQMPEIVLHNDAEWSKQNKSFGRYTPETHTLEVNLANRHVMDTLRTTAHELVHCRQNQQSQLPNEAGETGSRWENQAHALAGVIMRDYADQNPTMFENASGYIPKNKKEAKDPRWSMATSVDIGPGQVGKEANKLGLQTGRNGEPGQLMKSAKLRESRMPQPSQGPGKIRDLNEPLGPETPPQMPAGTTKIDVTDLTDWYRVGMDISDIENADPEDYNQGPPQTVVVFPSDEMEQPYLKQFKRLGLKTHDMDPDVPGGEDVVGKHLRDKLAEEFELFEEQDLMEIKMTGKNLSKLAGAIPGATVGLEFEMIVPNVNSSEEHDSEPDYDRDESVNDIDDACNFFNDGDYNSRRNINSLREEMLEKYEEWRDEKLFADWQDNGFEFFCEYIDREEPFDPEDYEDDAEQYVRDNYPDLDPDSEEFDEKKSERLRDINADYYTETWEAQGGPYDRAREEFDEEMNDSYDQSDWLDDIGVRTMSDVETEFGHVSWPHYTTYDEDEEVDTKQVALDFMNAMGMSSVAVGSYHGYGGGYQKWNGSTWTKIGSNKPLDCFTIEPDGSLSGDNDGDVGLEFVSPPIPLADIGTVMKKVQRWAGEYGVYTGEDNSTSMHTNISIPGYDLSKLDYLKAAILLGDEHVLRTFDRIGNTYAKPAIEKVKRLIQDKPEKAKELLDKMKSHLNAEASKLIHSGITDKYTSINTKDNRIEYRSPGGDYLSDIADNPQKMIDTINRMVVNIDAAMDPNKYKQEYQKKLYKLLTGDLGSRTAASGDIKYDITSKATIWNKDTRRQEPAFKTTISAPTASSAFRMVANSSALPDDAKMSDYNVTPTSVSRASADKDLLKYFTQYAAGELPKAALKSFVRQAQLQRRVARQKETGKMWWNVKRDGQRIEVVATDELDAKLTAAKEWGIVASTPNLDSMSVEVLRPYDDTAGGPQVVAQQPTTPAFGLWDFSEGGFINNRGAVGQGGQLIGGDSFDGALEAARRNGIAGRIGTGEVDIRPIPQQQPPQQGGGLYKIYSAAGTLIAGDEYGSDQEALRRAQYWAQHRNTDVVVKNAQGQEIGRVSSIGDITPTAQQPAQQSTPRRVSRWEIVNNRTGDVVQVFTGGMEDEATNYAMDNYGHRFTFTTRPSDGEIQRVGTQTPNFYIKSRDTDEIVKAFFANSIEDAQAYLTQWKRDNNMSDRDYVYGRVSTLPDAVQRNIVGNQPAAQQQSSGPTVGGRASNPEGNWILAPSGQNPPVPLFRFNASGVDDANNVVNQWNQEHSGTEAVVHYDPQQRYGQPAEAQPGSGEYGVWIQASERFARLPAAQANGDPNTLRTFPSREEAEEYLRATRASTPGMRNDIEVREIPQGYELPAPLGRPVSPAFGGQETPSGDAVNYEIYNRNSGAVINTFPALNDQQALEALADYRNSGRHSFTPEQARLSFGVRRAGQGQQSTTQFGANTPQPMYELVRDRDREVVYRFFADNQDDAIGQASDFTRMQGWDPNQYTLQAAENYRPGQFTSTENVPREGRPRNLVPTGPGPWEIYRISNGESVRRLEHTNRAAAEEEARSALGLRGEAPDLYGVRTQQSTLAATGGDAAQGGIVDVAGEQPTTGQEYEIINIETRNMLAGFRAANQAEAEQTAERMIRDVGLDPDRFDVRPRVVAQRPTTRQFTGEWKIVMPDGREVYRFGGVGNAQSDANRVAMDWLMRNRQYMQSGAEVLPVMG